VKKDLNFEINILPILDILSVLICFLLLTAVWMQVGTVDTRQAVGDNSSNGATNPPSLWIAVNSNGNLELSLRDVKNGGAAEGRIVATRGQVNWAALTKKIKTLKSQFPALKTVVIRPESKANYGVVIKIMDQLKQNQMTDIGLSPLS
jgi:biopolymer transport protein TolR